MSDRDLWRGADEAFGGDGGLTIEEELEQALRERDTLQGSLAGAVAVAERMERERDEARADAERQHKIALDYLSEREEAWRQVDKAQAERDEERAYRQALETRLAQVDAALRCLVPGARCLEGESPDPDPPGTRHQAPGADLPP